MNFAPELMYFVGAILLGLALAYGIMRNRNRNRTNDRVTEAATRESYKHPDTYNPEQFNRQVKKD